MKSSAGSYFRQRITAPGPVGGSAVAVPGGAPLPPRGLV
jgi:hypothetical protein